MSQHTIENLQDLEVTGLDEVKPDKNGSDCLFEPTQPDEPLQQEDKVNISTISQFEFVGDLEPEIAKLEDTIIIDHEGLVQTANCMPDNNACPDQDIDSVNDFSRTASFDDSVELASICHAVPNDQDCTTNLVAGTISTARSDLQLDGSSSMTMQPDELAIPDANQETVNSNDTFAAEDAIETVITTTPIAGQAVTETSPDVHGDDHNDPPVTSPFVSAAQQKDEQIRTRISQKQNELADLQNEYANSLIKLQRRDHALTIKQHIKYLKSYNEIRDISLGLLGMVADIKTVKVADVMLEYGVSLGE
ncbi:Swi5-domain-containing protein [Lipomyces japonicus]|uniref:Swi5-domain-containing protein n=1 Tax=Lipomyces japonicus TaxID=56871 RepID=UPI0034CE03A1